jgi:hypothetical protein
MNSRISGVIEARITARRVVEALNCRFLQRISPEMGTRESPPDAGTPRLDR